jgi:pyruvate-ferredoxin/flavodoxin oxidoreductase
MSQTVQALQEAEAYPGPSLVIAYSHCIAHGYDMALGVEQQKLATSSGVWPLYRYDPRRPAKGEPPLHLDSGPPRTALLDYMRNEGRFRVVEKTDPERFKRLLRAAETQTRQRYAVYQQLAGMTIPQFDSAETAGLAPTAPIR